MSTLLLADNDSSVRTTLARSLAGHGFAVIATANGREAVNVLKSRSVDILVTELQMPVMDGFALLAHVREHAPNLPAVVLTAASPADFGDQLGAVGPLRILHKPVSGKVLAHEAREALSEVVRGSVSGISLPSLLQMLQWERKSCSVRVTSGVNRGRLDFLSGELVNAYSYTGKVEGETAAYEVFSWDDVASELERAHPSTKRLIKTPLQHLLMDAMRQKDERAQRASAEDTVDGDAVEEDTVVVGETESTMFFRRNRQSRDAPAPPQAPANEVEAEPSVPPPAEVVPEAVPDVSAPTERLKQIREKAKATRDAEGTPREKADTEVQPQPKDEKPDIRPPDPEPKVESTTVAAPWSGSVKREKIMAGTQITLQKLIDEVDGAMAAMLVDYKSGMALGMVGGGLNLEIAAAGNTQVVRAKMKTMTDLGLKGEIEDILITLASQYHIIRILPGQEMFMYLVLDKEKANLAMARYKLRGLTELVSV